MTFATILTDATFAGGFGLAPEPSRRPPRLDFSDMRGFHVDDQVPVAILIDDFQVPGKPQFSYDISTGNTCSYETIKPYIKKGYQVYYPAYLERTSKTMNLVGWGLLVKDWEIPEELKDILC